MAIPCSGELCSSGRAKARTPHAGRSPSCTAPHRSKPFSSWRRSVGRSFLIGSMNAPISCVCGLCPVCKTPRREAHMQGRRRRPQAEPGRALAVRLAARASGAGSKPARGGDNNSNVARNASCITTLFRMVWFQKTTSPRGPSEPTARARDVVRLASSRLGRPMLELLSHPVSGDLGRFNKYVVSSSADFGSIRARSFALRRPAPPPGCPVAQFGQT